jgi:hypothetical protein
MIDVAVGRLLVASLHQAIADLLPMRLEFYESWLNTAGLREGRIGLAPLAAVLSFLRQEGEAYQQVTAHAGRYAATWHDAALPAFQRRVIQNAPRSLRQRLVLRVARRLIHETYGGCSARLSWADGRGAVDLEGSVFCGVRDRASYPLCGFYETAIGSLMTSFGVETTLGIPECRAMGAGRCLLTVTVHPIGPSQ